MYEDRPGAPGKSSYADLEGLFDADNGKTVENMVAAGLVLGTEEVLLRLSVHAECGLTECM